MEMSSRVLEINPVTHTVVWEYMDPTLAKSYSAICEGAQRLPNGDTLMCESTSGRIFEVTGEEGIVWEFVNPFYEYRERLGWTNYVFRAHRYGYDALEVKGKELDAAKVRVGGDTPEEESDCTERDRHVSAA